MRIYLDNCCFNRPYDDQENPAVRSETEKKLLIQNEIASGGFDLVWSCMMDYEVGNNPFPKRRKAIMAWRSLAVENVRLNDTIHFRRQHYMAFGLKSNDATHLACAVEAGCACFITTDKGVLRKQAQIHDIQILNPVAFVRGYQG